MTCVFHSLGSSLRSAVRVKVRFALPIAPQQPHRRHSSFIVARASAFNTSNMTDAAPRQPWERGASRPQPQPRDRQTALPAVELLASVSSAPFVDTHTHLHYVLDRLPARFGVGSYDELRHAHFPPNLEAVVNVLCD